MSKAPYLQRCRVLAALIAVPILVGRAPARVQAQEQKQVVATVGSHQITLEEVDKKLGLKLYELRRKALAEMIDDYVIGQAAGKAKLSKEEFLKREINDKVPAPSDEELRRVYDQHKAELKGQPFEKIKEMLAKFVHAQELKKQQLKVIVGLRKEAGVKLTFESPRIAVAAEGPSLGPSDAPVTIVEFSDFQCPFCRRAEDSLKQLRSRYQGKLRLVYRDFPLEQAHPQALAAAEAARCAAEQGKFWDYHDALFANQAALAVDKLKATAARLKLDSPSFNKCLDSAKYLGAVKKDAREGRRLGIRATPAFFINGRFVGGAAPLENFESIINEELAQHSQASAAN